MQQNTTKLIKRVIATQTITATTTLAAITSLLASLGANEVWEFTLKLIVDGTATEDIDVALGYSESGATLTYGDASLPAMDAVEDAQIMFALVDALPTICIIEGVISTGANAGDLVASAAQTVSGAVDTDILPGSSLKLNRIDDTV